MNTILLVLLAAWAGWRGRGARQAGRVRSWTLLGYRLTLKGDTDLLEIEPVPDKPEPADRLDLSAFDATMAQAADEASTEALYQKVKARINLQRARDDLKVHALLKSAGLTREVDR